MPALYSRSHYSIGDVLAMLQPDFPDVTVSKIRFLESQGLIAPERTPSGYRKFYDNDVERLRFILKQQKDHFLPLKVIKDRLDGAVEGATTSESDTIVVTTSGDDLLANSAATTNMSKDELSAASGIPILALDELERHGFLNSRRVAGIPYYDDDALHIAKLAAAFGRHGVEPKQLRVYKNAAEREVAMFEQITATKLRSGKPEVRKEATQILSDLALLGGELRAAMVRQTLRELLGG
jgi:DNA-binding transcriptional MerR regulator